MKQKKAQTGQIIIYITAILVIGVLIVFGGKLTYQLLGKQCDLTEINFQTKIQSIISENTRWGTVTEASIATPCNAKKICFVNSEQIGNQSFEYENKIITASVRDGIEENIFIIQKDSTIPAGYDKRIKTKEQGIICIETKRGLFNFWIKGLGKEGVEINK